MMTGSCDLKTAMGQWQSWDLESEVTAEQLGPVNAVKFLNLKTTMKIIQRHEHAHCSRLFIFELGTRA